MQVKVLFFASIADIVGTRQLALEVSAGTTIGEVLDRLETEHPRLKPYRGVLLTALNEEYVDGAETLSEGDEIAFFPPVSGGDSAPEEKAAQGPLCRITREPIDAQEIARALRADEDGAICVFEGVVRNNSKGRATRHLVYEGYEPMALAKMEEIAALVGQVWEIGAVAIVHRLGRLEIGETSVAIVVASPHRRSAFDACHYAIDRLKKIVPIWKKEVFTDGEVWVEGGG